jgi:phage/plasmid-like protein (TIGR03299 family)
VAHNLFATDTMMYVGKTPWHGLGKYVGDSPLTTIEALKQSGLDWRVKKIPIQAAFTHPKTNQPLIATTDEFFGVVRNTDLKILGIVKGDYTTFQNEECFDFMDSVLGEFGKVRWHTAGSLKGGKVVWMLAQLTDLEYEVLNGDVVKNYVLLSTTHDGSGCVVAGHTDVRVVCDNTRRLAMQGMKGDGSIKIRHKGDMSSKVEEAQRVLGLMTEQVKVAKEVNQWLASQKVDGAYTKAFVDTMFPVKGEKNTRAENVQKDIYALIDGGKGTNIPGVRGTRWGLLNAVTEYTNHHKTYRDMTASSGSTADENRLWSVWYTEGKKMADEALAYLTEREKVNG